MEQVKYINEKKVAELMDIGVQTLRNDRHLGKGIPYSKVGRSVRYKIEDIIAFMEAGRINTQR